MEINIKNYVPKFQEGGAMPAEAPVEEAPMEAQGGDPVMELAQLAMQALQGQDCEAAMALAEGFMELIQQMQGGAAAAPQGEPVYRAGGKLIGRMN